MWERGEKSVGGEGSLVGERKEGWERGWLGEA